jgi:hypothetical protein
MEDVAVAVKVTDPVTIDGLIEDINEVATGAFPTLRVAALLFVV